MVLAPYKAVVLELFVAPFTQNYCGRFRFISVFSIIEKSDLVASLREHLNRPGKKHIASFGLPPIAGTKIK